MSFFSRNFIMGPNYRSDLRICCLIVASLARKVLFFLFFIVFLRNLLNLIYIFKIVSEYDQEKPVKIHHSMRFSAF